MSVQFYQEKFQVPFFECDQNGFIHLSALINHLVLASERQLGQLGVGPEEMKAHNLGWVITEYQIEVNEMPRQHENVIVRTAATQFNKFFCYRDYWLLNADDEELVHVKSIWVMMSYENRRMIKLPEDLTSKMGSQYSSTVVSFPKIERLDWTDTDAQKQYQVRYFDIDANRHVNNAHYFDWMLDDLPAPWLRGHTIKSMTIRYEHEVRYGERITSQARIQPLDSKKWSYHRILKDSEIAAEAQIEWKS